MGRLKRDERRENEFSEYPFLGFGRHCYLVGLSSVVTLGLGSEEMASPSRQPPLGGSGLLRGSRARSYGSLVQSSCSPVRERRLEHQLEPGDTLAGLALKYGVTSPETYLMAWILRRKMTERKRYARVTMRLVHLQGRGRIQGRGQVGPMAQASKLTRKPPHPAMTFLPLISLRSLTHRSACQRRLLPRS